MALAVIALANVVGTYFFGQLGGILRRKFLLSVLYFIRAAATALFVRSRSASLASISVLYS